MSENIFLTIAGIILSILGYIIRDFQKSIEKLKIEVALNSKVTEQALHRIDIIDSRVEEIHENIRNQSERLGRHFTLISTQQKLVEKNTECIEQIKANIARMKEIGRENL